MVIESDSAITGRSGMGLFKPAWMGKDEARAMRALGKVRDDGTLFQIATECPHASVQLRAASRIQDRLVRLDVARTSRRIPLEVRMAALEGATEQELCDVAKCGAHLNAEGIRLEAVRMMTDEALLAEVAAAVNSDSRGDAKVRAAALDKVSDSGLLLRLMELYRDIYLGEVKRGPFDGDGDPVIKEAVANAYERVERPPFEWSMLVQSEKASNNIMLDLCDMTFPEDRDRVLAILRTAAFGKPLKQKAASLLPDDDPALDERCCPHCGTVGSVRSRSSWSDYWENDIHWYECSVCDQNDPGGMKREDEDFSITLRELRDM